MVCQARTQLPSRVNKSASARKASSGPLPTLHFSSYADTAEPDLLLSGAEPMTRQEAEALAIDLTHRSTPAEGGFCTFQPGVNGDACPWNLNCHSCD